MANEAASARLVVLFSVCLHAPGCATVPSSARSAPGGLSTEEATSVCWQRSNGEIQKIIRDALDAGYIEPRVSSSHPAASGVLLAFDDPNGILPASGATVYVLTSRGVAKGILGRVGDLVLGTCASAIFVGLSVFLYPRELASDNERERPGPESIPPPAGKLEDECPPCKTVSGRIVPIGTISYRPLDTPSPGKVEHGIKGPHHNIYKANQSPRHSPQPCRCFWQPAGAVPPAELPIGAIPIEAFAY